MHRDAINIAHIPPKDLFLSLLIIPTPTAAAAAVFSCWSLIILLFVRRLFTASSEYLVKVVAVFARSASPTALGWLEGNVCGMESIASLAHVSACCPTTDADGTARGRQGSCLLLRGFLKKRRHAAHGGHGPL